VFRLVSSSLLGANILSVFVSRFDVPLHACYHDCACHKVIQGGDGYKLPMWASMITHAKRDFDHQNDLPDVPVF
jgi:hypothetical protein